MATLAQMRSEVLAAYPGEKWRARVSKMSDSQIFTLYTKFKALGRIK